MVNTAFQKSLRSKDKDKFVASLRYGGMVEDKSYLQETLSNVVPSGKKLLKETVDMIMNPVDTAKSLYQLGSGVVQLAIPGEQKNEEVARAAGQYFADRYGSLEKAKESLKNDPVGVITEVLGVAAGGAGLGKVGASLAGKTTKKVDNLWTIPDQKITSADTSINVSKLPQGYNILKKENVFKKGDVVLDIGGGKFDNAVKNLAKSNVEVKVYDPFNRSPEHNQSVVNSIKDGGADKVVSFNTLNVIPEEVNRLKVVQQAYNALKNNGQAFFTVYEKKGAAGSTNKGYQTAMSTKEYIPLIESVFGEGSVTLKNKVIRAEKKENPFAKLMEGGIPTAATGIGIEEIKVKADGGGGGGRGFREFRGSGGGREYAMNYEPSRGGVEQGGIGSQQPKEEPKEETPEIEEIVVTGSYDNTLDNINKLTTWYANSKNPTDINKEKLAEAVTNASKENNVNADFLTAILAIETDLKEGKTSSTGAEGLSQIDPSMLKDINRVYKMNLKMEDLQDIDVAVDAQAKAINIVRMYAKYFGHDHNDNEVIGQIYNIGIGDYNKGKRNPRYFGDRGKERADIMGVDIFSMPMTNDVPELQEGGTPWGGATGTIYEEPSGPKPVQQQMINAFSEGGISDDKPSLKKKASFAPFLDTGKKALEFAGAFTGPIGAASFLGRQIASGEGYSGEPLSGNNTAGMNVTSGNAESGRGTRSATTATPDTIVRQPKTEQDYEERVSVYDNSIKEKQELEQYFKDNFLNPNAGKTFESYDGTILPETSFDVKIPEELEKLDQDLINKKLIKIQYATEKGPVKLFVSIKDLYSRLSASDPVQSYIAGLALEGLGQGKSTVVDPKNKNSITVKFTSTVEESI